jgi:ABC-type branched-subunit amino acid transport system ATPase component/ABC-type branched-subunit amino acid transport system permease subunit
MDVVSAQPRRTGPASKWRGVAILVALVPALYVTGITGSNFVVSLVSSIGISAIGAMALVTLVGWAGQASVFIAGLLMVGGYTTVVVPQGWNALSVVVTLLIAGLVGAVLGGATSLPARRLSGVYLLLSTLGFQFIAFHAANLVETSTGRVGGYVVDVPSLGPYPLNNRIIAMWFISGFVVLVYVYLAWLRRGRIARSAFLVRTDRGMADVAGIRSARYVATIFALTGALMSIAGVLNAYYTGGMSYETFDIHLSIAYFVMIAIGGVTSLKGAIAGAAVVTGLNQVLTVILFGQSGTGTETAVYVELVYATVAIVILLFVGANGRHRLTALLTALRTRGGRPDEVPQRGADVPAEEPGEGLVIRNVRVRYSGAIVGVDDVSVGVERGTSLALVGPNGAGKTSLLRAVAGFPPSVLGRLEGPSRVWWKHDDERVDLTRLPGDVRARLGIAFVPADGKVFPELTVAEHLQLAAGRSARIQHRIGELFDSFSDLQGSRPRLAGLLSGGQRQQLALLCALASEPKLLVVDELTLGLSPVAANRVASILAEIQRRERLTMLVAEQNVGVAFQIAQRVALMRDGKLVRNEPVSAEYEEEVRSEYVGKKLAER